MYCKFVDFAIDVVESRYGLSLLLSAPSFSFYPNERQLYFYNNERLREIVVFRKKDTYAQNIPLDRD